MLARRTLTAVAVLALLLPLAGCLGETSYYGRTKRFAFDKAQATRQFLERCFERESLQRVKPWERDLLALEEMSWDPDGLQSLRRSHIYFSKEASLAGGSSGGGGCGCN